MTRRALRKWQIKILNLWSCNLTIEHFDTPKSVSVGLNLASFKLCNINHLIHTYELRLLGLSGIWSVADDRVLVNLAIKLIISFILLSKMVPDKEENHRKQTLHKHTVIPLWLHYCQHLPSVVVWISASPPTSQSQIRNVLSFLLFSTGSLTLEIFDHLPS